jgi:formylmethanofuran dehydrogenase subunit E-like metal-binding protein
MIGIVDTLATLKKFSDKLVAERIAEARAQMPEWMAASFSDQDVENWITEQRLRAAVVATA